MADEAIPTVLVPGLACSARLWVTLLPAVWAHGAATIADTRRDSSMETMAQRLLDQAPARFALVGISMGGYVCLEVMRRAPDRVRALALISTSAVPDTPDQLAARQTQLAMTRDGRYDDLVTAAFPALVDEGHHEDPELFSLWSTMAHELGAEAFTQQLQAVIDRPDFRPTLAHIACPSAVIHGIGDRTIPVAAARETAAGITGARLTLVEAAGHMTAQERPDQVRAAVVEVLERARA